MEQGYGVRALELKFKGDNPGDDQELPGTAAHGWKNEEWKGNVGRGTRLETFRWSTRVRRK
jgi:hypothetical protein